MTKSSEFKFLLPQELKSPSSEDLWLIDRLIPRNACCLIAGAPKTRKSWFVYELLVSIATGTKAFGTRVSNQGSAMLIQGEDSSAVIKQRLQQIASTRKVHSDQINNINILSENSFYLDNEDHFDWITNQVMTQMPSLLVLDPFARLVYRTNENSAGAVAKVLGRLRSLQRLSGTTIVVVHHYGKNGSPRGSSDFHGWLDAGFYLSKPNHSTTQVRLEFKAFPEEPDFFFKLENTGVGIAPVSLSTNANNLIVD